MISFQNRRNFGFSAVRAIVAAVVLKQTIHTGS
jgi:hypothetical protein